MPHYQPREVPITPEEFDEFKRQCREERREWTEQLINMIHRLPYQNGSPTLRSQIESSRLINRKPPGNHCVPSRNFSPLRRTQTWREFYATIDRVLQEVGIYDEVRQANRGRIKEENIGRICTLIYPAYVRLREMGYNCYPDLTA
ncbi:MAG: hypothetical protein AABX13_05820 [Nanoarchaeota archaeon]